VLRPEARTRQRHQVPANRVELRSCAEIDGARPSGRENARLPVVVHRDAIALESAALAGGKRIFLIFSLTFAVEREAIRQGWDRGARTRGLWALAVGAYPPGDLAANCEPGNAATHARNSAQPGPLTTRTPGKGKPGCCADFIGARMADMGQGRSTGRQNDNLSLRLAWLVTTMPPQ